MRQLDESEVIGAVRAGLGGAPDTWIVGGTIRDALLGRPLRDVDVATAGDPRELARAVARSAGGHAFAMSDEFGTWRCIVRDGGWVFDASPLQGETIEEDLSLRDFTVNAMAVPLFGGSLLDPKGGSADLDARVLRVLGAGAYERDPLRALRLPRLAAELGFAPDAETERLTRDAAPLLGRPSPERVWAELRRLVIADGVLRGLALADRLAITDQVLPELAALRDVEQSAYHHLDVHDHTLEVLERLLELERDPERWFGELAAGVREVLDEPLADELTRGQALRFGALLHDIGKPATRAVQGDGRVTFIAHDRVGEEMVDALCRRLRTSTRLREFLRALTRQHLVLGFLVHERPLSRRAVYHYLTRCSPVEVEVTILSCADRLATRGRGHEPAIEKHMDLAFGLVGETLAWRAHGPPAPLVRGNQLAREIGVAPGPELGSLLGAIEEAQFAGEVETPAQAIALARSMHEDRAR